MGSINVDIFFSSFRFVTRATVVAIASNSSEGGDLIILIVVQIFHTSHKADLEKMCRLNLLMNNPRPRCITNTLHYY